MAQPNPGLSRRSLPVDDILLFMDGDRKSVV